MSIQETKNKRDIRFVVSVGMFSALSYVVIALCQFIPNVSGFLSVEIKDAVIVIASFIYGPWAGVLISFIVSLLESLSFGYVTAFWGFLMNFISSSVFALTASIIYRRKKSLNSAILGVAVTVLATTVTMVILDIFIVPMFFIGGWLDSLIVFVQNPDFSVVMPLLLPVLLPFNFAKALLNGAVALMLYKPIINAMRAAGIIEKGKYKTSFNKTTVVSIITGSLFLIVSLSMIVALLILFPAK